MIILNKFLFFLVLPACLLISSCSPISTPASELLPTISLSPSPTITPTNPTSSINNSNLTNLSISCIEVSDIIPIGITLKNSLVLSSLSDESYILNLETNNKIYLGEYLSEEMSVSPDLQKLAYLDLEAKKLIVKDVDGMELKSFDGFDGRFHSIKWLDNENLAINKAKEEQPLYYHYSLVIFNILTNSFKEFNVDDFPNGYKYGVGYPNLYPNSQLTEMVYSIPEDGSPIVLFDMQTGSQLRKIYFSEWAPEWVHDGTKFIVSATLKFDKYSNFVDNLPYLGGNEIFLVKNTGEINRLTFLTTKYKESHYSALSWSPTEEYIAFDLINSSEPNFGLSVLDVNTGEITNYCIDDRWDYIYWSSDGKQIAFTRGNGFEPLKSKAYILDLEKKLAFKIADNVSVKGWMINTP